MERGPANSAAGDSGTSHSSMRVRCVHAGNQGSSPDKKVVLVEKQ